MKKTISLLLMSFIGLVGTYAWAGSAREDSVARLQSSVDVLLSSKFQLSGEGSIAAGPVGRLASAGTDWKMNTEMLTYSRSKGVFAGLTLEGAVVQQDDDSTRAIYGKDMTFRNILSGKVSTPKSADAFIKAVSDAGQQARIAEATEDNK